MLNDLGDAAADGRSGVSSRLCLVVCDECLFGQKNISIELALPK
jgi:hypothetical protein